MAEPAHSLEEAIRVYETQRSELLRQDRGKFALIYGSAVEVFSREKDAFRSGYEHFGNVPFLVRQIAEENPQLIARSVDINPTR